MMIKQNLIIVWEIIKVVILALLIVLPIRYFLFQPFVVKGESMYPNFFPNDYLIVDQISYRFRFPQRGDVIVFKYPLNPSHRFIKRIIGLPDETIEIKNNKIIIHNFEGKNQIKVINESEYLFGNQDFGPDQLVKLGENEYYVLGDNRSVSLDSRKWGSLPRNYIIGRVYLRLFPFNALMKIETPSY